MYKRQLEQKSIQEFELVYRTKIHGFRNIWKELDHSTLTHVLLFSSGAGFFGNPGQSDYAIANETMNQIAWDLQRHHPHIKVISYNWGPWDGGMVDENLKKLFHQRGVQVERGHSSAPTECSIIDARDATWDSH